MDGIVEALVETSIERRESRQQAELGAEGGGESLQAHGRAQAEQSQQQQQGEARTGGPHEEALRQGGGGQVPCSAANVRSKSQRAELHVPPEGARRVSFASICTLNPRQAPPLRARSALFHAQPPHPHLTAVAQPHGAHGASRPAAAARERVPTPSSGPSLRCCWRRGARATSPPARSRPRLARLRSA